MFSQPSNVSFSGKRPLVVKQKRSFVPVADDVESCDEKRERLLKNLSAHIPQSLSVQYWRKEKEVHATGNKETSDDRSGSKLENKFIDLEGLVCSAMEGNEDVSWEEKCTTIKKIVGSISKENIVEIERLTLKQNESDCWHKARYAHVTASRCHEVMTRKHWRRMKHRIVTIL